MIVEFFTIDPWLTLLGLQVGIFGAIAGIFGANAQKQAAQEAARILAEARKQGLEESKAVSKMFDPFVAAGGERLGTSFDVMQRLVGTAEAGAAEGMTAGDKLAFEDTQRLINENLVATGNLRSGAGAFASAEVGRRVLADASQRRLQYLNLAIGAGQQLGGIAQATGQLGLGGKQISSELLQASMGLAPAQASAQMAVGAAKAAGYQAWGQLGGDITNMALGAFGGPGIGGMSIPGMGGPGGFGGALMGASGVNFGQLYGMQQLLPLLQGGGGATEIGGAASATKSDRRLKSNIKRLGTHPLGIGLYEYDIAGEHTVGVMADEVLLVRPAAVSRDTNGYLMVDYAQLD